MADTFLTFDSKLRTDNNIGNAESPYLISDNAWVNTLSAGQFFVLSEQDYLLTLQAKLKNEIYQRLHGLSNTTVGASAELKHKLGMGAYAPSISSNISLERFNYSRNDRSGWAQQVGMKLAKRISERSNLIASANFEGFHADHNEQVEADFAGNVFEKRSRLFALNWDYACTENTTLSLGVGVRKGDVNVTTIADYDELYAGAKAIRPDPSFGNERDVYRIRGNTQILSLGFDTQVTATWRLGAQIQRQFTYAEGDNRYYKNLFALTAQTHF
jgi:hypothetical protein